MQVTKDKIIVFLVGVIVGIGMMILLLVGYTLGRGLQKKDVQLHATGKFSKPQATQGHRGGVLGDFKISFEGNDDLEFFSLNDGLYVEQSKEFTTDQNHSLLAEFPGGAQYPGLTWEVYRKDKCLNWNKGRYFVLDLYNNSEIEAELTVKLKSGPRYPKKTYQTQV
ncbi:MAG: hypothetical protein JSW40_04500, partial [Candidatus Omnitrophota bacterium]